MNSDSLQKKLLAAARAHPPSDRVPYAFEKRVMARLREQPAFDVAALWTRILWKAAAPCVVITLLIGSWAALEPSVGHAPEAALEGQELPQQFEQVMLADIGETAEEAW